MERGAGSHKVHLHNFPQGLEVGSALKPAV